jgi:tight adherence protein B
MMFAVYGFAGGPGRQMRRRAENIHVRMVRAAPSRRLGPTVKRARNPHSLLDKIANKLLPRPKALSARLARTGYRISMGRYLLVCGVVGLAFATVAWATVGLPWIAVVSIGTAAGFGLPHYVIGRLGQRRLNKFTELFPDAIDLMVRGLKSGLPISECINTAAREIIDPVGTEFSNVSDRMRFGVMLEDALWETAERLDTPDFKFFAISLGVQRETGGNLAETLANLSDILRRRKQMKLKIKAISSEARASSYILGSLPFLMVAILLFVNADYVMTLFNDPRGVTMVVIGLGMLVAGVAVMFKMASFEI